MIFLTFLFSCAIFPSRGSASAQACAGGTLGAGRWVGVGEHRRRARCGARGVCRRWRVPRCRGRLPVVRSQRSALRASAPVGVGPRPHGARRAPTRKRAPSAHAHYPRMMPRQDAAYRGRYRGRYRDRCRPGTGPVPALVSSPVSAPGTGRGARGVRRRWCVPRCRGRLPVVRSQRSARRASTLVAVGPRRS